MSSVATSDMDTSTSPSSPTFSSRQTLASIGEEEHPNYHFYDGSLAFQLEGLKFRIHGSLLARHCSFTSTWADDLRDPETTGIKRTGLEAFLSMLYLATYETLSLNLSVEEWISVLHLATRWKADGMRALAINILTTKAPALRKLVLCHTYNVPSWLEPACAALALRPTALTIPEAEELEKSDIVKVFLAREAVSKGEVEPTEADVSSWLAASASEPSQPLLSSTPPTMITRPASQPPSTKSTEAPALPETEAEASKLTTKPGPCADAAARTEAPKPSLSSPLVSAGPGSARTAQLPLPSDMTVSQSPEPVQAPISEYKVVNEVVNAIRAKRYDHAFALSWNKNQAEPVARRVADSFVNADGTLSSKDLLSLARAAICRTIKQPGYIPVTSQLLASLSTHLPRPVQFEVLLHDDMQSLSSRWSAFRAGATPANDHGGFMDDLTTHPREIYQQQMGNGKGLFRALVRLGVLPEGDQWVGLLIK